MNRPHWTFGLHPPTRVNWKLRLLAEVDNSSHQQLNVPFWGGEIERGCKEENMGF